ncbi:MAG TPA: VWA domain-containing protein, partial [Pyrinomonadaceae bacterium]|nr:VWA domain-containing protein [Pyrinomonadaceae bacterium]
MRRGRICASILFAACLLAGLLSAPAASTQNRARTHGTSPGAAPARKPQTAGAVGPYVPPSADDPEPPSPRPKPSAEPRPQQVEGQTQKAEEGKQAEQEINENEVVRINAAEVLLPVTVRDSSGALVTGLGRKDFKIFEDGREQPLSDISLRQVPVDVALLVDASSSVAESFEDFRRAAEEFSGRVSPEDRFCLVKFDDRVELLLDWSQSRLQLRRALNRLTTGVFTRFNDALLLSAREQFQKNERRRALVVLSDGIDSNRGSATTDAAL